MDNELSRFELAVLSAISVPVADHDKVVARTARKEEALYTVSTLPIKRQRRYVTMPIRAKGDEYDRYYSPDMEMLMSIPDKNFGIIVVAPRVVIENSFTIRSDIPKGYAAYGSYDSCWQFDCITTATDSLRTSHVQTIIGIKGCKVDALFPVRTPKEIVRSSRLKSSKESAINFAVSASVLEDYDLNHFWHVDLTDAGVSDNAPVTIATYAREEDAKSFLDLRTAPLTKTGQRKRVLHWVSGHQRCFGSHTVEVQRHLRGLTEYTFGGFNIKVTQPIKPAKGQTESNP